MTVAEALTIRAAFANMKKKLAQSGIDTEEIHYITDLPPVLQNIVPENIAQQAEELLSNEELVNTLLSAFTQLAKSGAIVGMIELPTDEVKEGDLYA